MLEKSDIELLEKMFSKSENLILEELERTRKILEKQIEQVNSNLDELNSITE